MVEFVMPEQFQTPPIYRTANNSPAICYARTLLQWKPP